MITHSGWQLGSMLIEQVKNCFEVFYSEASNEDVKATQDICQNTKQQLERKRVELYKEIQEIDDILLHCPHHKKPQDWKPGKAREEM